MIKTIISDLSNIEDRAEEINVKENFDLVTTIVEDLKDTMKNYGKDLLVLTAPQIGYNKRIFCIRFGEDDYKIFINPMITKNEGVHLVIEHNVSLPNAKYLIPRSDRILVMFQSFIGLPEQNELEGGAAEIFQQALEMLDGVYLNDIGLEINEDFEKASKEEQDSVIQEYLLYLKDLDTTLQTQIKEDEELKQVFDAIKFMQGVQRGEIKLEESSTKPTIKPISIKKKKRRKSR